MLVVLQSRPPEWAPRGGTSAAKATLRIFCSRGEALAELLPGQACPLGSTLAFVAKTTKRAPYVHLRLESFGQRQTYGPLRLSTTGSEVPIDVTPRLEFPAGEVTLTATFAPTAQQAQSPSGLNPEEDVIVVTQRFLAVSP
jgi:hypothetical protein